MKEKQLKSIRAEALKVILLAQNMDRAFGDDDEQQREHLILAIMAAISDAYHNGIKKGRMEAQESAALAKEYVSTEDTFTEHKRKSALGEGVHVPRPVTIIDPVDTPVPIEDWSKLSIEERKRAQEKLAHEIRTMKIP